MMQSLPDLRWLKRHGVLVALVFGYLMMALLAREQARTIASQSALIRELFQDSLQLTALRMQRQASQDSGTVPKR